MPRRSAALLGLACCLTGCSTTELAQGPVAAPAPNYSRALPPGDSALRLVTDLSRLPDLADAYRNGDELLVQAIDRSLDWYSAPSSRRFFPFEGITHEQARNSLLAIRELLSSGLTRRTAALPTASAARHGAETWKATSRL